MSSAQSSLRFVLLGLALTLPAGAQTASFTLAPVATVDRPIEVTYSHPGDDRVFIAAQAGRIFILDAAGLRATPFLDIADRVLTDPDSQSEQGLLGLAFHPDYAQNGRFFVSYTDAGGDSVIARFERSAGDPDRADEASERILLRVPQPDDNHNVGALRFGRDDYLYIAAGDGGFLAEPRCSGQQGDNLRGKVLRIDVDQGADVAPYHAIPPSNPFVGVAGVRDEIWALGLRNPWRFSFDRLTGDLYLGDPGQNDREEIDFEPFGSPGGRNYGWKMMEGNQCRGSSAGCGFALPPCFSPLYTAPAFDYGHDATRCAVIGGQVYRGGAIPELVGWYVFGDFCGQLFAARRYGGGVWQVLAMAPAMFGLVTFGEDAAGELYAAIGDTVYRIADADLGAQAGVLGFAATALEVPEGAGSVRLVVTREDGSDGVVDVGYRTVEESAVSGADFIAQTGFFVWGDGDSGERELEVSVISDARNEGDETFRVELFEPTGGATLGAASATVTIVDDDLPAGDCVADENTLCLDAEGRFQVTVDWRTGPGAGGAPPRAGRGVARTLTEDAGWFFFFRETNPEIFVKVLDGCRPNGHYWVFAGGLTDVETELVVVDTQSGLSQRYRKPLGLGFTPIRDTRAFATCP